MARAFAVPATRNALPSPIAPSANPTYSPGPVAVLKQKALSYLTGAQRQITQGGTEPKLAVLSVNSGKGLPPVHPASPLPGVKDIRPISLRRRGGVGPGGNEPGQTANLPKSVTRIRQAKGVTI
jgi:hypothetical protein